jgi:leader peptidase (prepilin peptidase)/N-methyltransferase
LVDIIIGLFTAFISGAIINILVFRLPGTINLLRLKNYCLNCKKDYRISDYIPLYVFIFNRGRCKSCNSKFSIIKLYIDIIAIVVVFTLFIKFGISFIFLAFVFLLTILIAILFIDLKHLIVPDILIFIGIGGGFIFIILNFLFELNIFTEPEKWWKPLLGIIPGTGFLLLIAIIGILVFGSDRALGMGDVKIFVPIGMFLGLEKCILAVILSFLIGGVYSIIILISGNIKRKKSIPFTPFIVLAAYISIIAGDMCIKYIGILL